MDHEKRVGCVASGKVRVFAASVLLGLSGSAYGFVVNQVAIVPDGEIVPDVGSFVTLYQGFENYMLEADWVISLHSAFWDPSGTGPVANDTTYLGMDPQGPGNFQGVTDPLTGPSHPAPSYSGTLANKSSTGLLDVPGTGLATKFLASPAGFSWGPNASTNFEAPSAPTLINGVLKESLFIGQFIMDTPGAIITGDDLLVTIDGVSSLVPLDGSFITQKNEQLPFQLSFIREPAGPNAPAGSERVIAMLGQVPSPGVGVVMACGGLVGLRRRRR